ncbi:helix-turn-helix domain-containing protein [Rummeliibacillus suwonensis]|uniref:helix-turn-helix domain-containing protein n=1 Tax=Rummeliibacillus suwonensis TaxID=1306154 RepID=UPI001AB00722|nr:helix-turn-helix domain-containing protein [Rummeliibacillus suwonensis]MBO2536010.1 helix-turn-helix domain-containing protein [Rummeliibacillus suwonensis]
MMAEKIKILLVKKKMSTTDLAAKLNVTPQNFYNKFKRDNFSEKELVEIAQALGVKYEGFFLLDDGNKI